MNFGQALAHSRRKRVQRDGCFKLTLRFGNLPPTEKVSPGRFQCPTFCDRQKPVEHHTSAKCPHDGQPEKTLPAPMCDSTPWTRRLCLTAFSCRSTCMLSHQSAATIGYRRRETCQNDEHRSRHLKASGSQQVHRHCQQNGTSSANGPLHLPQTSHPQTRPHDSRDPKPLKCISHNGITHDERPAGVYEESRNEPDCGQVR